MHVIYLKCPACDHDNPAEAFHCANCQTVLRIKMRSSTAEQPLAPIDKATTEEEELIHEAYLLVSLLVQSVQRLRALIDQRGEG